MRARTVEWGRRPPRGRTAAALVSLFIVFILAPAGVSRAAGGEAPRWALTSVTAPTILATSRDEVQELIVRAESGVALMEVPGHGFVVFTPSISAQELQQQMEETLGAGNVQVTGGPGDLTGSKPYILKLIGALAGESLGSWQAFGLFPEPTESIEIRRVQRGASGGEVRLTAVNVGGQATDGSDITISDVLPAGLSVSAISGFGVYGGAPHTGVPLACSTISVPRCTYSGPAPTGDQLIVRLIVKTDITLPFEGTNRATVSGGGAEYPATTESTVVVDSRDAGFGVAPGSVIAATSTSEAGAHPDVTTGFQLNTDQGFFSTGNPKDVRFNLPPGLVGNTVGIPRCSSAAVTHQNCPRDTVVGMSTVFVEGVSEANGLSGPKLPYVEPVFNIAPSPGEPAAFEMSVEGTTVRLDTSVLSGGNYGVRVSAGNIAETIGAISTFVTIWGVPADHEGPGPITGSGYSDPERAGDPLNEGLGGPLSSATRVPLLSNPTQCSRPLVGVLEADTWRAQGVFDSVDIDMGVMTNCHELSLSASMSMLPDTLEAGAPAGYSLALHIPQANDPDGLASPDVKRVVTTLPMGTVVSPSAAWGLNACTDAQFGLHSGVPAECPREAQVGTVQIKAPALPEAFSGQVYLAAPDCHPCTPQDAQDGRMVRLFVQAQAESRDGILVKLEGTASINQQTGQITTTFDDNPQLPFSDFKLTLGGGSRATLANPRVCGPATTTMGLLPWSEPFNAEFSTSSTFEVNEGCLSPKFDPSFVAGTTNIQAGEYSPFTLSFGRQDSDQFLNGLQLQMPAGLLGSLSGVPLCKEPQAREGTCGQDSLIGHTQVLTGPGGTPFLVTGGQVFLTEGYRGAPFGLSIVVPAVAGPYTLSGTTGNGTVVVRAAINIDPHTAALTVTSDPLPTALDGIPLQLKVVNVTVDRAGFTFNPTSCAKMAITGRLTSKEGPGTVVSSPFQVTNCAGLGFKPQFKVSTSGKTSRAKGASLDAKVVYPAGAKLANIAKVKVSLPKQLPSRLTTLQKACPAATFEANPAACSKASVIGIARASTPVLPVPLSGPVYFVSHGGEAFPNLVVVLQGYGVRVDLVGDTFISKAGITSSTFKQVPDVPISSFELYLPQGPYSALAANGNLCKSKLLMPTVFVAQNGAELHQNTKIAVNGCVKTKAKKRRANKGRASRHAAAGGLGQGHRPGGSPGRGGLGSANIGRSN